MILHLDEIIETAILTHKEGREHGSEQASEVYMFFGAVDNGEDIKPIRLKVKEYDYVKGGLPENIQTYFEEHGIQDPYSSVYDSKVLVLDEIEKGAASSSAPSGVNHKSTQGKYPSATPIISVVDLLGLVNGDYQKYIPINYTTTESTGKLPTSYFLAFFT